MKKSSKVILLMLVVALTITCCVGLVACGDGNNTPPPNDRLPYAGEYEFAGFKVYKWVRENNNFMTVPYDGDEDDAFAECYLHFTKEYALEEANKQSFTLNADGTATWTVPSNIGGFGAASSPTLSGTWNIWIDEEVPYFSYSFNDGGHTYTRDYTDFSEATIECTLWLLSDFHSDFKYQFSGAAAPEGYSTDNTWEIHALYKRVAE
ncbi:MAG: hypothetical protein NC037_05035 [Bacteroides sp.]|nr:hypothetical protein [Bacillota bacterium]MCM1394439.1 hypothetical protein [[Eubacterium] siraeum]MCM1455870.1 hypothetical protein [Bacteroides sp.]